MCVVKCGVCVSVLVYVCVCVSLCMCVFVCVCVCVNQRVGCALQVIVQTWVCQSSTNYAHEFPENLIVIHKKGHVLDLDYPETFDTRVTLKLLFFSLWFPFRFPEDCCKPSPPGGWGLRPFCLHAGLPQLYVRGSLPAYIHNYPL